MNRNYTNIFKFETRLKEQKYLDERGPTSQVKQKLPELKTAQGCGKTNPIKIFPEGQIIFPPFKK